MGHGANFFTVRSVLPALLAVLAAVPLAAAEGLRVSGTVAYASGEPAAGVELWISQQRQVQKTRSEADGAYQFTGLGVGPAELTAYQEGFAVTGRNIYFIGDAAADLELGGAAAESLQIFDTGGRPVAGAQVKRCLVNDRFSVSAMDLAEEGFPRFRSDDNGVLVLRGLPESGYVKISVSHPDYVDSELSVLPIGQDVIRSIVLEEGIRVRGLVEFEGEPAPGARAAVFVQTEFGQREINDLLTDRSGFFLCRLLPGEYQVALLHPDHASPPPAPLIVERGEEAPLQRYSLLEPRFIEGSIQYPGGEPCPGAGVSYRQGDVIFAQTLTGMDGAFRLQVASTQGFIQVAPPRGYQTKPIHDLVEFEEARRVRIPPIELEALPRIEGQILDEAGEGADNVLVRTLNLMPPLYAITDGEGRFAMELGYMPDTAVIQFRAERGFSFHRSDFDLNWQESPSIKVHLRPFSPNQEQRAGAQGGNNLEGLLNKPAPDWDLAHWFAQHPVSLQECRGKVVVLLFWGGFDERLSWLALEEFKALHALHRKQEDVYFLAIHDSVSTVPEVEDYITYYRLPFDVGVDNDPQVSFTRYKAHYLPLVVLIDKEGVVRYYQTEGRLLELIKVLRRRG